MVGGRVTRQRRFYAAIALTYDALQRWIQQSTVTNRQSSISHSFENGFHVRDVLLEGAAAGRGQAILGPRHPPLERLVAGNVLSVLELARVDAQVAIGRLQQALQIVERQPIVHRERTVDAETKPLVNDAIEIQRRALCRLRSARRACDLRLGT